MCLCHCCGSCSSGRRAVGMRAGRTWELLGHSYSCSTSKPNKGPFPFCRVVLVPQQRGVAVPNRQHRGRSVVVGHRTGEPWAGPAAGWRDVKEGPAELWLCEPDAIALLRADAAPTPEHLLELWGRCLPQQQHHLHSVARGHWQGNVPLFEAVSDHTRVPDTADGVVLKRCTDRSWLDSLTGAHLRFRSHCLHPVFERNKDILLVCVSFFP